MGPAQAVTASNACTVEEALAALGFVDVIIRADTAPTSVVEWAERWLTARTGVSPRTQRAYGVALERHVLPIFGDLALAQLSRSDIEMWVNTLQPTMAPKTVQNVHGA